MMTKCEVWKEFALFRSPNLEDGGSHQLSLVVLALEGELPGQVVAEQLWQHKPHRPGQVASSALPKFCKLQKQTPNVLGSVTYFFV